MLENTQNNYDFDKMFSLAEEIVIKREFKSLIELNEQCGIVYQSILDGQFDREQDSQYLDCLYIFLYYIYYIMLQEDEELLFINLRKLVMYNNGELVKFYYNNDMAIKDIKDEHLKNGETELYNLFILAMYILNKYNSQCGSSDLRDLNDPNVSKIINILYRNNYVAIPNEMYVIFMLGNKVLDYRKILELSAYDNLQTRLYDILLIVLDKYHKGILFSELVMGDETDGILEEAEVLNW